MQVLILIFWGIMSLFMLCSVAPNCDGLSWENKITVIIIVAIGGPFLMIAAIIESLLNSILPKGWDDDDDDEEPKV